MIVQLGYLNLFGAVFPFMAVLALANNTAEIRVDAFKLLKQCRRPTYKWCADRKHVYVCVSETSVCMCMYVYVCVNKTRVCMSM